MLDKKSTIKKKNNGKNNDHDKTTGLYKIAAKIIKKVKTGNSYKTELYQAQYPVRLLLLQNKKYNLMLYQLKPKYNVHF